MTAPETRPAEPCAAGSETPLTQNPETTGIIIHGAAGRMGRMVEEKARAGFAGTHVAALVDPRMPEGGAACCYAALDAYSGPKAVVVDFSDHTATAELLDSCVRLSLPLVLGTTGHTEAERAQIYAAAERIPLFYSGNMSLGIAVLTELAKRAAAAFPDADIEIVEIHHNQKLDVPSGTALMLANAIQEQRRDAVLHIGRHENGKRTSREIGIHSVRLGSEVGTHEILISTGSETLTLKHQAGSRALFAEGALAAAAFLSRGAAPGLYSMKDLAAAE